MTFWIFSFDNTPIHDHCRQSDWNCPLFQVKAFVHQVESSAKKQLNNSGKTWVESNADKPVKVKKVKSPESIPSRKESIPLRKESISSKKESISSKKEPSRKESTAKEMVLAASRNPNGNEAEIEATPTQVMVTPIPKPQFYFGQTMSDLVKKSSVSNGQHQTAIEKVKKNEALSHPKRAELEKKLIISVHNEDKTKEKASSMSSGVSSLSSNSSTRSSPAKEETSPKISKNSVKGPPIRPGKNWKVLKNS